MTLPTKSHLQVYDCSDNALTFSSLPRKTYMPSVYLDYSNQAPFDISALGLNKPYLAKGEKVLGEQVVEFSEGVVPRILK